MIFDWITQIDFLILDFIRESMRTPVGDWLMVLMSSLGDGGLIWIALSLTLLFFRKTRKCGVLILISMALGAIMNDLFLKNIIGRVRPCNVRPEVLMLLPARPQSFSFMSGHTLSSFAAATVIFLHSKKWAVPAGILAALIAFSRLYVYVHFPSDVIMGMITGILLAVGVTKGADWLLKRRGGKKSPLQERNKL